MNWILTRRMIALAALFVSALMAACGVRSASPSAEAFTVYQDAPKVDQLDLGPPGNSPGDLTIFRPRYIPALTVP
jgi:hypothetical protein